MSDITVPNSESHQTTQSEPNTTDTGNTLPVSNINTATVGATSNSTPHLVTNSAPVMSPRSQERYVDPLGQVKLYSTWTTPEDNQRQLLEEYFANPQQASFGAISLAEEARLREISAAYARVHSTDSTKAANRKDWAAGVLNVSRDVVDAAPDFALQEAEYLDFLRNLRRNPTLIRMLHNPDDVKLLTAKDPVKFKEAQTIIGGFMHGVDLSTLTRERNAAWWEVSNLINEGKTVPSDVLARAQDLSQRLEDMSGIDTGVMSFAGMTIAGLAESLWAVKGEVAAGAGFGAFVGASGGPVGALFGAKIGATGGFVIGGMRDAAEQTTGRYISEMVAAGVPLEQASALSREAAAPIAFIEGLLGVVPASAAFKSVAAVGKALKASSFLKGPVDKAVSDATRRSVFTSTLKDVARDMGFFGVMGAGMGAGDQAMLNYIMNQAGVKRDMTEGVGDMALSAGLSNMLVGGLIGSPRLMIDGFRAVRSSRENKIIRALEDTAADTDLTKSNPDKAAQIFNQMAAGTGREKIYIDADELENVLNKHPEEADDIRGAIPDYENQKKAAKDTGSEIEIDIGTWLTKIANKKAGEELKGYARTDRGALTDQELAQAAKDLGTDAEKDAADVAERVKLQQQRASELKEIELDIKAQLKATGISNRNVTRGAQLYTALIRTFAERMGISPKELYKDMVVHFARKPRDENTRGGYDMQSRTIFLDERSDASTVAHEGAHWFLDTLDRMSETNDKVAPTMEILYKWFGVTREQWRALDAEGKRQYHEQFAEAWEQYLSENVAPSTGMKKLLNFFTDWITNAYRGMSRENMVIPDEVRGVFDRMIATDEEIQAYREMGFERALLQDEYENFMTPEEQAVYKGAIEDGYREAGDWLRTKEMAAYVRVARKAQRFLKKLEKQVKDLRKGYRAQAEIEVKQGKPWQLLEIMKGNEVVINGQRVQILRKGEKFSYEEARRLVGDDEELLNYLLSCRLLSKNKKRTVEGLGYVAELLGIDDLPAEMRRMRDKASYEKLVEAKIDEFMERDHSDINTRAKREKMVQELYAHTDAQAMYALEIKALLRRPGVSARTIARVAKGVARRAFDGFNMKKADPRVFMSNDQMLSRKALQALKNGDVQAAARYRYQALINREMARMAMDFKIEKQKALKKVQQLPTKAASKNYDLNWILVAQVFANKIGLSQRVAKVPQAAIENNPQIALALQDLSMGEVVPLEEMTVGQFRDAMLQLDGYIDKARQEKLYQRRGQFENIETAVADMSKPLRERKDMKDRKGSTEYGVNRKPTMISRIGMKLRSLANMTKSVETLCEWLDGTVAAGQAGPWVKYVFQPIREASTRGARRILEVRKRYAEILTKMDLMSYNEPIEWKNPVTGETYVFNASGREGLQEIMMILIYAGNPDNWNKLVIGGRSRNKGTTDADKHPWGFFREDGTLDDTALRAFINDLVDRGILKKHHFEAVQELYDLFGSMRNDIQKARYAVEGKYIKEIEGDYQLNDIAGRFGLKLKGGYTPVVYDNQLYDVAASRSFSDLLQNEVGVYLPQTANSFLKNRTASALGGVNLELKTLDAALQKQAWYCEVFPTLNQVDKLLRQPELISQLERVSPNAMREIFQPWMMSIARNGAAPAPNLGILSRAVSFLNERATAMIMSANIINVMQQITGYVPALPYIGFKNMIRGMAATLGNLGHMNELRQNIEGMSDLMRQRWSREDVAIQKEINKALGWSRWRRTNMTSHMDVYLWQQLLQNQIDKSIWWGAFNQFIDKNSGRLSGDELNAQAAAYADGVIVKTQSSYRPEDKVALQNINEIFTRMFGMFFSYFTTMRNAQPAVGHMWARRLGLKNAAPALIASYLMVLAIPDIMSRMIIQTMRDKWSDDDEEFKAQVLEMITGGVATAWAPAYIPFVGGYMSSWIRKNAMGQDAEYLADSPFNPPSLTMMMNVGKAFSSGAKVATGDEITGKDVQLFIQAVSMLTGNYYITWGARPAGSLYDWAKEK